jgi:hypothetical protein
MKNVITVLMIVLSSTLYSQTEDDYVKISGRFYGTTEHVTIEYRVLDTKTNEYKLISSKECKKKYSITIDPTRNYEIGFHSDIGSKYIVHKAGNGGMWSGKCDLDFSIPSSMFIYQINDERYGSQIIENNPTLVKLEDYE